MSFDPADVRAHRDGDACVLKCVLGTCIREIEPGESVEKSVALVRWYDVNPDACVTFSIVIGRR
jgi:hypothetical protein